MGKKKVFNVGQTVRVKGQGAGVVTFREESLIGDWHIYRVRLMDHPEVEVYKQTKDLDFLSDTNE